MEESRTAEDHMYVVEGMQFDRGYISPYFVTDPERMVLPQPLYCRRKVHLVQTAGVTVACAASPLSVGCLVKEGSLWDIDPMP